MSKRDSPPFIDDESSVQTVDTEELPLDYGGSAVCVSKILSPRFKSVNRNF